MRTLASIVGFACVALSLPGQGVAVTTTSGEVLRGEIDQLLGAGREANLRLLRDGAAQSIPLSRVLAIHGAAPVANRGTVVHLAGGDQIHGQIQGGDAAGETLIVRSRSLGEVHVLVDRLHVIVFDDAGAADLDAFGIPEGAEDDEAVFRKALRGFDVRTGAIDRFSGDGVWFVWGDDEDATLDPYRELAAIALRGGDLPASRASARLVTRSGDVVGVELVGAADGRMEFRLEGDREVSVDLADVSSVTFTGADRTFVSELEPERIEERGSPFEEASAPLYPHRRDRATTGGFLVVANETHGVGLGVHSRCVLSYRVPAGMTSFTSRVGVDDSVLRTPVRGNARVRVVHDGRDVFGPVVVKSGEAPLSTGVIEVRPGALLTLEVDFGDGWFIGDRVDWLSPVFLR